MGYHYESHTTTTDPYNGTQTTSVIVRELDEGEVGILLAGNNSIVDPSLTPRMLSVSTTDYDVENAGLSPLPHDDSHSTGEDDDDDDVDEYDEDNEHWFPSLRHNSWIQGLDDDDDDIMVDKMVENLFATAIVEKEDDDDDDDNVEDRQSKSRKRGSSAAGSFGRRRSQHQHQEMPRSNQSSSRTDQWMDDDDDDHLVRLVPVDIIYVMIND